MKTLFLIILLLIGTSCSKKVPNPEQTDEIFLDLKTELDIMTKTLEAAEKDLASGEKELKGATPQTGQYKSFETKYFNTKNNYDRLKQQKLFFEIKLEQRIEEVRARYLESFTKGGRPWPDKTEIAAYKLKLKLHQDKMLWDKNKGSVKKVPRRTNEKAAEAKPTSGH